MTIFINSIALSQTTKFRANSSTIKVGNEKWDSWGKVDRLITFDDDRGVIVIHSSPNIIFYKTSNENNKGRLIYYAIDEYDKPVQIIIEDYKNELAIYFRYVDFILAFRGDIID